MRYRLPMMTFLSLLTFARPFTVAQQLQPNTAAAAGSSANHTTVESEVAPDAAVITLHGLCGNAFLPGSSPDTAGSQTAAGASDTSTPPATPNPNCETVVTRQQFENLIKGMNPKGEPQLARGFAMSYPETLIFARKAIEIGLDKDPDVKALLQYRYQQSLYSIFKTRVKQKANEMSDAEVEKFYNANRERYERFSLLRIHVPDTKEHHPAPGISTPPKVDPVADKAAMKTLAIKIRAEAVAGGDFEKLQAKAYRLAGVTDDPPDTDLGDQWTRDNFPTENVSAVFALKPGQISQPIHNASGWHIIKVVSRKTIPLSEARDQTLQLIVGDQANSVRKAITTELNDQYFVSAGSHEAAAPLK